ncbi:MULTISPECIES: hypothetical protein [unclassified Exiguobacterium]|uniref:hypothetical protein n=1 Tax=unclassified Exiguobacterium TaxID=2644629 RepID=UPI000B58F1AB|nr:MULTISPECIES: hypothetical protein [unclassified Exiguobacterium]ASI34536.1 hypothetical protein A0126_02755 [Exiguobacterium sp. N4-1P]
MKKVLVILALSLIGLLSFAVGISYAELQSSQQNSEKQLKTMLEKHHGISEASFLEVKASFSLQHRQVIQVRLRGEPAITYEFIQPEQTIEYSGSIGTSVEKVGKQDEIFRSMPLKVGEN